jgi:hypothetical protein
MRLTLLKSAFFIVWFGLPIFSASWLEVVGQKYILQESGREVVWESLAAATWLLVTLLIPGMATLLRWPRVILVILFLLFWAETAGGYAGGLAICLINCVGDSSEPQLASIAKIDRLGVRRMTIVTISAPWPGVVFPCPNEAWLRGEAAGKRFFVHKGRLGLLWGELR